MSQPVQECGRQGGIPEHLHPIRKAQIGRDDHRAPLMALGQNLKQVLTALPGKIDVSQLIETINP